MEHDSELIFKILVAIKNRSNSKPDSIFIIGYEYELVFQHLMFLYKDGLIHAETQQDETGEIVQIFPSNLTNKGSKYLKELTENNK